MALLKVAGCAEPFNVTVEFEMKLVPLMVMFSAAAPAVALEGVMPVIVGTGLFEFVAPFPPPPHPAANKHAEIAMNTGN